MQIKEFWNFRYKESLLDIELGDINNNGDFEIVAISRTGTLVILSQKGEVIHQELISKDVPIWHLRIYDINNDRNNELILGGMDGILRIFKCNLVYNLKKLWNHKFNSSISGFLIEDINNDNLSELIVYSLDKTIRVLNSLDGSLIWGQVFEDGIGDATIFSNDKKIILAGGNDGTIRTFNGMDGNLLWFKGFSNKIRCVSYLNSIKGLVVLCGGDDKKLHFINKETQTEFKTIEFEDYIWKCFSYPHPILNNAIISSYSFDYFDNSIALENRDFSSKIICLNEAMEVKWEVKGFNIECLNIIEIHDKFLICGGTTKGELIIFEEKTGRILFKEIYNSCLNSIQFSTEKKMLFCGYDDGTIISYKFEEIEN
ncbi:MAG: hypothetical protein ACFFA4_03500 [Promethearchaeota archaeon]